MAAARKRGRGEGSIQQRPDGTWRATISLGIGSDGKRKRRDLYGKTKAEVQKKMRKEQSANDAGVVVSPAKTTVTQYLNFWFDSVTKVKASTKMRYRQLADLHVIPQVGNVALHKLAATHIDCVISACEKSGLGATTRRNVFAVLRKCLNDAVKRDLIAINPTSKVEAPSPLKKQHKIWTAAEAQKFLDHTKTHRLHPLFVLSIYTGMRQGEALSLQWGDIDWKRGRITIQRSLTDVKGRAVIGETAKTFAGIRTVDVPAAVMDALDKHRGRMMIDSYPTSATSLVFVSRNGGVMDRNGLVKWTFKPQSKKAGVPIITWHQMRHSAATMLLESGVPITNVSKLLGHASPVITAMIYSHVTDGGMQQVAKAMESLLVPKEAESVLVENGGTNGGI
jgi:integrase